jgi:peptidoglycan hydrolase-like protein with peptidoglycan-binding domain
MATREEKIKALSEEVASLKHTLNQYADWFAQDGYIDFSEQAQLDQMQGIIRQVESRLEQLKTQSNKKSKKPQVIEMDPITITGSGSIGASVGNGGKNKPDDVYLVQSLLNDHGYGLTVDGKCGAKSINAIKKFQKSKLGSKRPDGRVDVGGKTWSALSGGSVSSAPQTETIEMEPMDVTGNTQSIEMEPMNVSGGINASVGNGGKNHSSDVSRVQSLLNNHGYGLTVDGKCGNKSIGAIKDFQRKIGAKTIDGRVDPNGTTWKGLTKSSISSDNSDSSVYYDHENQMCVDNSQNMSYDPNYDYSQDMSYEDNMSHLPETNTPNNKKDEDGSGIKVQIETPIGMDQTGSIEISGDGVKVGGKQKVGENTNVSGSLEVTKEKIVTELSVEQTFWDLESPNIYIGTTPVFIRFSSACKLQGSFGTNTNFVQGTSEMGFTAKGSVDVGISLGATAGIVELVGTMSTELTVEASAKLINNVGSWGYEINPFTAGVFLKFKAALQFSQEIRNLCKQVGVDDLPKIEVDLGSLELLKVTAPKIKSGKSVKREELKVEQGKDIDKVANAINEALKEAREFVDGIKNKVLDLHDDATDAIADTMIDVIGEDTSYQIVSKIDDARAWFDRNIF